GKQRGDGRGHPYTSRWTVLWRRTFRHVDVDVRSVEHRRTDTELDRARLHQRLGGRDGLLHHVLQIAGHGHAATTRHLYRFDRQQFAADLRPGKAGDDTYLIFAVRHAVAEFSHASIIAEIGSRNRHARLLLEFDLTHSLAGQSCDFALKVPHAALTGVVADQVAKSAVFY